MTRDNTDTRARTGRSVRPRRKSSYFPPQHGAWAFLALPLALGATVSTWDPLLALLAIAWIAAYPMSYAAFGLMRAKRSQRFRAPFFTWAAIALIPGVILVIARPWLLWVGVAYALLLTVNLYYARHNDERALVNDGVFILECAGIVAVTWAVAAGTRTWTPPSITAVPADVWILVTACALVLLSSTLHVKSLIRERRNRRYAIASRAFAVASLFASIALGAWWGWPSGAWFIVPFTALAVRAFLVPGRQLRPGAIGVIELVCFLITVAAAALAST